MAEDYSAADPLLQPVTPDPVPTKPSTIHNVFVGPNGIRAGWRLLIFLALDLAIVYGIVHIPGVRSLLPSQQIFTAKGLLFGEGVLNLLPLLLAAGIMTLIEKRSFADYGMPLQEAFGKRFWQGVPLGFVMLSILLLLIGALHGFSIDGIGVGGTAALSLATLYFIGFIFVGMFEEFSFRGYMQSTLGSGIGFWPAAIILSIVFGAIHLGNSGEAKIGAFMAGFLGLGRNLFLRNAGQRYLGAGAFPQLVIPWTGLVDGGNRRARRQLAGIFSSNSLGNCDSFSFSSKTGFDRTGQDGC
jgi:membrane protease YdiL (CAAX protease family)